MGCGMSSKRVALTEDDKALIRESWQLFHEGDIVESGTHLFTYLFEKIPEARDVFYFTKDVKGPMKMFGRNRQFDNHVSRVFEMLDLIIDDLDDEKLLETRLVGLGAKHASFAIKKEYFMLFGDCLLHCVEHKLGDKLTPEMKEAWIKFMYFVNPLVTAGWTTGMARIQSYK